MPTDTEKRNLLPLQDNNNYGSLPRNETSPPVVSISKKVVYCVHGKPSAGCCRVLEGEIIDIPPNEEKINAKENADTTALGNSRRMSQNIQKFVDVSLGWFNKVNKHCHQSELPDVDRRARRKLIIASILCVIFMIGEIVGGYLSNSLAIASDAAHLLTDFASFMISLFSLFMATRPSTKKMPFGWYRAEVIGALTSVLLIWVVTGVLVYMAIQRLIGQPYEIDAKLMLITSGVGVIVNLIMGFTLHQHGHSHHGHSHEGESGHKEENINVRAAFIHVLGDFLQSFGVFLAAIVIYFKRDWIIVDPICTFIFSVLVLITTFAIMKDAVLVLMEAIPKGIDFEEVMNILLNIEGVKRVHNLRIWALSLDKIAMSAHVAISPGTNPQNVLMMATKDIHDKFNFFEMTLQIEEFQDAMEECQQCKNPS
nr:unnamed protein product [Callosobruchus analis]